MVTKMVSDSDFKKIKYDREIQRYSRDQGYRAANSDKDKRKINERYQNTSVKSYVTASSPSSSGDKQTIFTIGGKMEVL